jgi:hypothetical protein
MFTALGPGQGGSGKPSTTRVAPPPGTPTKDQGKVEGPATKQGTATKPTTPSKGNQVRQIQNEPVTASTSAKSTRAQPATEDSRVATPALGRDIPPSAKTIRSDQKAKVGAPATRDGVKPATFSRRLFNRKK